MKHGALYAGWIPTKKQAYGKKFNLKMTANTFCNTLEGIVYTKFSKT
jgi:hypothetical protein